MAIYHFSAKTVSRSGGRSSTAAAAYRAAERIVDERSYGVFSRQLFLGETLDADQLSANYDAGVLTIRIPIAEKAKPRKVEITSGDSAKEISA